MGWRSKYIMDVIEIDNKNEELDKREDCKVFDYLSKHPTVLISIISACVIVISFILNSVNYMKVVKYLQSWGINADAVNIDNWNEIYQLAGISILILLNVVFMQIMSTTLDKHLRNIKIILIYEEVEKKLKKSIKKINKNMQLLKEKMDLEQQKALDEANKTLKFIEDEKKKKVGGFRRSVILTSIIVGFFSIIASIYMFILIEPNLSWGYIILFSFILVFSNVFLLPITNYWNEKRKKRREIKFDKIIEESANGRFDFLEKESDDEYILDKLLDLKLREVFSDKRIRDILIILAVWISITFVFLYFMDSYSWSNQTILPIVHEEDKCYAIIYANNDFYYLEEVEIKGEKIDVHLTKQKLISKDGVEYQVYTFENENVNKIPKEKETNTNFSGVTSDGIQ